MDSRHESLKEGFLNHVIMTINSFMIDNLEILITDKEMQEQLIEICKRIYHYLDVDVDTVNIISKHNLLSKDVVLFPGVPDPEGNKILGDEDFRKLIESIRQIIKQGKSTDGLLKKQLNHVMDEFGV